MARPGLRNCITDVAGLSVGSAHDAAARTGVTVIAPDAPAVCAAIVCGGGPGTRETDALAPENLVDAVDAVVLSGGSVYGLAAADGVVAALGARGKGFSLNPAAPPAPVVPAAILYDLANGGDKAWGQDPPYRRLAAAALEHAGAPAALGKAGAGFGARAGAFEGGQGAASLVLSSGETVAALACVNCWGSPVIPGGQAFWAWALEQNGEFGGIRPHPIPIDLEAWGESKLDAASRANTTIAAVATDAALTPAQARRVAQMAAAGLAMAIRPVFAPFDGDVVFALSTARRPLQEPAPLAIARLGAAAADCLARAVCRGIYEAHTVTGAKVYRQAISGN